MAKCKECVYEPMCYKNEHFGRDLETDEACEHFREAAKMLEVPVNVGDTVYIVCTLDGLAIIDEVTIEEVSTQRIWTDEVYYDYDDIGKTVFLTREEAEKALAERSCEE